MSMEINDFWQAVKRKKTAVFSICLAFLLLGSAVTFLQSLKYEAQSRLLIVQNLNGADPYTVSRSNQYLSSLLSQVSYSNSFLDLVINSQGFDIDKSYFSGSYKEQMKTWKKTISAKSIGETGIFQISIYHPNPYQAKQIALAVNNVLINQSFNYQGAGDSIKIKVIDQPLLSDFPVRPNIAFNLSLFLLLGVLSASTYIYLNPKIKKSETIRRAENNSKEAREVREENFDINANYHQENRQAINVDRQEFPPRPEYRQENRQEYPKRQDVNSQRDNRYYQPRRENRQPNNGQQELKGDINNIVNRFN